MYVIQDTTYFSSDTHYWAEDSTGGHWSPHLEEAMLFTPMKAVIKAKSMAAYAIVYGWALETNHKVRLGNNAME